MKESLYESYAELPLFLNAELVTKVLAYRRRLLTSCCTKKISRCWEGRIVVGHKGNGKPIFRYLAAKTQKELL